MTYLTAIAWPEIILVFLLSAVKMLVGLLTAFTFKFDSHTTFIICSLGGLTGCTVFIVLSSKIWNLINKYVKKTFKKQKPKKIFTPKNRRFIKIKSKFGLPGLAILTPTILSIPLGCFLALKYFKNKAKVAIWMFGTTILWALMVSYLYDYFK